MSDFANNGCFKEAVCIEAMRIFDSCSDKDCLEDLEVVFSCPEDREKVEKANFVKAKCVEVINAAFTIDPVPFNKGFFTVDITYTFKVDLEVFVCAGDPPCFVSGTTVFNKKVILYGSDGGAKIFSSDESSETASYGCCFTSLPRASVSVVEPIILDAKIICKYPPCPPHHPCQTSLTSVNAEETEAFIKVKPYPPAHEPPCCVKKVFVTIGMFSIVQLSRPVPLLMPAYDYCIPEKECTTNTDSPCELFDKIKFPTCEFFPKSLEESECDCGCKASSIRSDNDASED